MAKTKRPLTPSEELRRYAGHASGARWEEAYDAVTSLEEHKDAAEEASQPLEELEGMRDTLETLAGSLDVLRNLGMANDRAVDAVNEMVVLIDEVDGLVSKDDLAAFVEAYEEADQGLQTYSDTKDQDPFPGKREELESAWMDATGYLETLADALDTAQFQGSVTTTVQTETVYPPCAMRHEDRAEGIHAVRVEGIDTHLCEEHNQRFLAGDGTWESLRDD